MAYAYNCLSCGNESIREDEDQAPNTMSCPKCGRDMYRSADQRGRTELVVDGGTHTTATPAVPSRYGAGGAMAHDPDFDDEEDDDYNSVVLPHTPFVVILGFIFSLMPVICFAGLIISYLGLRLVNESPQGIRGRTLAYAGMIIGAIMCVVSVVLMVTAK